MFRESGNRYEVAGELKLTKGQIKPFGVIEIVNNGTIEKVLGLLPESRL